MTSIPDYCDCGDPITAGRQRAIVALGVEPVCVKCASANEKRYVALPGSTEEDGIVQHLHLADRHEVRRQSERWQRMGTYGSAA